MLRQLSSLPLAIGELAVIALLSAIGTVIEQNRSLDYYMRVMRFPLIFPLMSASRVCVLTWNAAFNPPNQCTDWACSAELP